MRYENPAVLFSGGIDSLLVLSMMREEYPDIAVVTLKQNYSKAQWAVVENVIKQWDLEVRSWPPMRSYLVPNEPIARVDEYSFGEVSLPVIRDIEDGSNCVFEMDNQTLEHFPFDYDVVFVGSREDDHSPATGRPLRSQVTDCGNFVIVAPLWKWTKDMVRAEAQKRGLPPALESSDIQACTKCLGGVKVYCPVKNDYIDPVDWNPGQMLGTFRERFGF